MRERPNRTVGSWIFAERTTGVCEAGERGVCDEAYTLPDGKGGRRPGWSFLFEQGRYNGFSPDDVELILEITGEICPDVADYEFTSVLRLRADFHRGRFAPAFQPEQRATVHEAAASPILCGDPTMIELDTLAARLDARLAELYDREAELEHETRNPAYDLATKAEREGLVHKAGQGTA